MRSSLVAALALFCLAAVEGCSGGGGDGNRTRGMISLERLHSSEEDMSWGTGVFTKDALYNQLRFLKPDFPAAEETCEVVTIELSAATFPGGIDAGPSIEITGPAAMSLVGNQGVDDDDPFWYGPTFVSSAFLVSRETYEISGIGGERVDAFGVSVQAPTILQVLSPAISTTGSDLTLDASEAFIVTWDPGLEEESVFASFYQADEAGITGLFCRFADDGSGTISSADLESFSTSALYIGLHVYRSSVVTTVVDGGGETSISMLSTWKWDVALE